MLDLVVRLVFTLALVVFTASPVVFIARLARRSKSRPPILLLMLHGQTVAFLALFAILHTRIVPRFARLFEMLHLKLGPTTRLVVATSDFLRHPVGAFIGLLVALALLRVAGRILKPRWLDCEYPSRRLDQIGLSVWGAYLGVLAFVLLSLYGPIHRMRPTPVDPRRPRDPVLASRHLPLAQPFLAEILRDVTSR